jgi:chorismate mutase/prephenate dehydrogenase
MTQPSGEGLAQLAALRAEIDALDRSLVALLGRRRAVVARMRALKAEHALPRVDPERERSLRAALLEEGRAHELPDALVHAVLDVVLEDSRQLVSGAPVSKGPGQGG